MEIIQKIAKRFPIGMREIFSFPMPNASDGRPKGAKKLIGCFPHYDGKSGSSIVLRGK